MNDMYFDNVVGVGKLYLEHIFYEFESEPIIFTCVDKKRNMYLCLCSEIRHIQKWIITECSINTLKLLIQKKMDIASAFLKVCNLIVIEMDLQGNERSYIIETKMVDRLDLPEEKTYIVCDERKAQDYLWSKELENLSKELKLFSAGYSSEKTRVLYHSSVTRTFDSLSKRIGKDNACVNKKTSMYIKHEYSVCKEEKYREPVGEVDFKVTDNSYLDAA